MCGLAGMCGTEIKKEDREMFQTLLYVASLRGMDATGVFTAEPLEKKDLLKIKKMSVPSPEFIMMDLQNRGTAILEDIWADVFIGHTRSATVGKLSRANAHPFDVGNLVGAHNGTLNDFWSWGRKGSADEDKTDSQMMFERMNEKGIDPVLREMVPGSAYAISVYNKKTRRVTLARNKERPLFVSFNKERGVLYWASTVPMLEFAAATHGIEIDTVYLEARGIYEIDVRKVVKGERIPWDHTTLPPQAFSGTWTRVEKKDKSGPNYLLDDPMTTASDLPWWEGNEDCVMCNKMLSIEEQKLLQPVRVDGVNYWVCEECANESEQKMKADLETNREKVANNQNFVKPESSSTTISADLLNIVQTH